MGTILTVSIKFKKMLFYDHHHEMIITLGKFIICLEISLDLSKSKVKTFEIFGLIVLEIKPFS